MNAPKKVSPAEKLKEDSRGLRGKLAEHLAENSTHFPNEDKDLLKAHGTYQQDDRDLRQALLKEKKEPAHSLMVRIKVPGGKVLPEQYLAYEKLADDYANGTLRVTTRQGFQFHGVLKQNAKTVIRGVNKVLGTTIGACGDVVRNVMANPEIFPAGAKIDIFKYAKEVSDLFISRSGAYHEIWLDGEKVKHIPEPSADGSEPIYGKTYLPRKFKIAMTYPEDNHVDAYSQDLGIIPEVNIAQHLVGFNIIVGGGFGMTHGIATTYPRLATPLCFVKPEDLLEVAKAIVLTQRDHGNRANRKNARLKYLIDEKGIDWFRSEVEKRFGKPTEPPHEIKIREIDNYLGWRRQEDGKWCLGLYVENGRIKDTDKIKLKTGLREMVAKYKTVMYLSAQQDVLLSGFEEEQKKELEEALKSYGIALPSALSTSRHDAMACPALPTCGLAISESERALPEVMDAIGAKYKELGLEGQRILIRMTGCPNGCARPYNAELAFVGKTAGTYNVYVGGSLRGDRLNFLYAEKVKQKDLASSVEPLLEFYSKNRESGEGFGDFCNRIGQKDLQSKVAAN